MLTWENNILSINTLHMIAYIITSLIVLFKKFSNLYLDLAFSVYTFLKSAANLAHQGSSIDRFDISHSDLKITNLGYGKNRKFYKPLSLKCEHRCRKL